LTYRPEIDGLRALAITAVVLFHFFRNLCPLGYLGVDVFFVISGYLITSHLLERERERYLVALKDFYIKRCKRIFPALFVFLLMVSIAATYILTRSDLDKYFDSLIASQTFWANLFFWRYETNPGETNLLKPLAHMWSLSVEEQFYILYPIFIFSLLYLTSKFKHAAIWIFLFAILVSLLLWLYLNRIGGRQPAFYLLPTRSWQFGFGGIIALLHHRSIGGKFSFSEKTSYFSILVLAVGFFLSLSHVANTFIVTVGATLFVLSLNKSDNYVFKLFSSSPFLFIGKTSYSIYLYHWPIAVFTLYLVTAKPSLIVSSIGLLAGVVLGSLSFWLVEVPFRYRHPIKNTIFLTFVCALTSIAIIALQ